MTPDSNAKVLAEATARPWHLGYHEGGHYAGSPACEAGEVIARTAPGDGNWNNAEIHIVVTDIVDDIVAPDGQERIGTLERDCRHGEDMYVAMRNRCAGVEAELKKAEERIGKLEAALTDIKQELSYPSSGCVERARKLASGALSPSKPKGVQS